MPMLFGDAALEACKIAKLRAKALKEDKKIYQSKQLLKQAHDLEMALKLHSKPRILVDMYKKLINS